jgi:hypothetical protein
MRICADSTDVVEESDEGNNCKRLHPFYVVPLTLKGGISGAVGIQPAGVKLAWAGTAAFELEGLGHANQGSFEYRRANASVTFTLSGGAGGCTWRGSGTYTPAEAGDRIDLRFGARFAIYSAHTRTSTAFHFTATITCPPPATPITFELFPANQVSALGWLATGVKRLPLQGLTRLRARNSADVGAFTAGWRWNLAADG